MTKKHKNLEADNFMFHVFNVIPTGFFNNLASGSNQRIYSDCIQLCKCQHRNAIKFRNENVVFF